MGGVIRDQVGNWLLGYSRHLGSCSILEAELWGIFEGINMAWSLGVRRIEVECDSKMALQLVAD